MKKDDPNDSKHQSSPSTFQCLFSCSCSKKEQDHKKKPKKDDREVPLPPFPFFLISSPKRFHQKKKKEKTNTKVSSGETPPVGTRTSCLVLSLSPRFPSWPSLRLTEERTTTSPGKKKKRKSTRRCSPSTRNTPTQLRAEASV